MMAQKARYLLCKHEDLGLILRTHIKKIGKGLK